MSLDSEIADLTGAANSLIDVFNKKDAVIEEKLQGALAMIPENKRVYYVDQLNGSDSNEGNAENPLKTIEEAVNRTPYSGKLDVFLYGDYTFTSDVNVSGIVVFISPVDVNVEPLPRIVFSSREEGGLIKTGGLVTQENAYIQFYKLNIQMPDISSMNGSVTNESCCVGAPNSGNGISLILKINYCTVTCPENTVSLMTQTLYFTDLLISSSTIPANMAGHWILSVAANTTISSLDFVRAKGITSL